jgi:hypothetical protein
MVQQKPRADVCPPQSAVREKINLATQSSAHNERKSELKAELDGLKEQQSSKKYTRSQLLDQVKSLQDNLQKKVRRDYVMSSPELTLSALRSKNCKRKRPKFPSKLSPR